MKQKTKFTALSVACIGCMAASGTLAAYDSTVSVVNNLSMDTVDISLSEYSIDDGREVPYQNKYSLFPIKQTFSTALLSRLLGRSQMKIANVKLT